jgi:alpha-tubulin suppressor-like RCC1 family protein
VASCAHEVAAGGYHTCARKGDRTLWCWGANGDGDVGDGTTATPKPAPVEVTALGASVAEVAAGLRHTCARTGDGTLWCWGYNKYGQVGDGTTAGMLCDYPADFVCRLLPVAVALQCPQ